MIKSVSLNRLGKGGRGSVKGQICILSFMEDPCADGDGDKDELNGHYA